MNDKELSAEVNLPKWIDALKGRDPLIDDLIGYIIDLIRLDNEKIAELKSDKEGWRKAAIGAAARDVGGLTIAKIVQLFDENTDPDFGLLIEPFARAIEREVLATSPAPRAKQEPVKVPEGWKLVAVNPEFDNLMYWLDRCDRKGDLVECIEESWGKFEFVEADRIAAAPAPSVMDGGKHE